MPLLTDAFTASRRNLIAVPVLLAGAAVAIALGMAGTHYWPGTQPLPTWGFSAPQIFKAYLSSVVLVLIGGQVLTAVWIYRFRTPRSVHIYHRLCGVLAFVLSLPVASTASTVSASSSAGASRAGSWRTPSRAWRSTAPSPRKC